MEALDGVVEVVKPNQEASLPATVEIAQSREVAKIQAAMIVAKKFPRNVIHAQDRIKNSCTRPGLAQAALYEYARGGTAISGPSIRLAEAIAQNWGNIEFGIRELSQRNGVSEVEAFAWDMETNVCETKTFHVQHKRHTKRGSYKLEDPRDIYEMVANQGARRLRACILGVIPGDIVEGAVEQCEQTLRAQADVTPERISSLLDKFGEYNVSKKQIEARIQRRIDAITPGQMVMLGKIYNSIKDGMSVPSEWFEVEPEEEKKAPTESLKEKLKKTKKPEKALGLPPEEDRVVPCPNEDGEDRYVSYCNEPGRECRQGCPSFPATEGGA